MTEKRFVYVREKYTHGIQDVEKDGEPRKGYRNTYGEFDLDKITDLLNALHEENEQLKQKTIFVNLNSEEGCWNCKHCYGGFCEILENPIVNWLKGVSKCDLKKWEMIE